MQSLNPDLSTSPKEKIPRTRVIQRFSLFFDFFWTLGVYLANTCTGLDLNDEEDGRREEGRVTRRLIHSVPVGFGSGSGLFLLWMVCWRLLFGLSGWSGLVWFGLVWLAVLSSEGGVVTRSVLSGRSFVSCCMLYTVLVLSCLCALFGIKLEMGDIELAS